jgi:hypothetical protein
MHPQTSEQPAELRRGRRVAWALGLALAAACALFRGPLHWVTRALPVSNDEAIPLLMARQVLRGELSTTLWNQPYNGALDSYLLAPLLALLSHRAAFRLYEAVCAVLLGLLVARLAGWAEGKAAAWAAAFLVATGSPYMILMAATGPTPNFLVPLLVGATALAGFRAREWSGGPAIAFGAGLLAGLAVWDSALALPALVGLGAGLAAAGLRPRPSRAAAFGAGLTLGLGPLVVSRAIGATGASEVMGVRPPGDWASGVADLVRAARGLLGVDVTLVIDGPQREALPSAASAALAVALAALVVVSLFRREAWPLLGWALGIAGAFALSRRTSGDEIRYLYGIVPPLLALVAVGWTRALRRWPAVAVASAGAVLVPWGMGSRVLVERWSQPAHAADVWQVPPVEPALRCLERIGADSAYASLQFAGRLALEAQGRLVVSQAWNERIPGDPLRFRDEVDLDPKAAWVLSPHLSRGMPRAGGMRSLLQTLGGRYREEQCEALVVFSAFAMPYDESRPVPRSELRVATLDGRVLSEETTDRDRRSTWVSPVGITKGFGLSVTLARPRRLAALVLGLGVGPSPLGVPWACQVGGQIVATGPISHALQWVNGVPRAARQAQLTVLLGDRLASEVRLVFQGTGPPLALAEVFAYGPDETRVDRAGAEAEAKAFASARRGDWDGAARLYAEAARLEPERASLHSCLARASWRAERRRWLDIESLGDGGPEVVARR